MLVLTRKPGETLTITPPGMKPIVITTIQLEGSRVRLGIEADRDVDVIRTEIIGTESRSLDYVKRGAK